MIVDTSAIVAILLREPEAQAFLTALARAQSRHMSAASWVELTAVLVRQYPHIAQADVLHLMETFRIVLAPVTTAQALHGEAAYRQYGRGTGHAAKLNFGDCLTYALAKESGHPLLFKGDDFGETDIVSAL